jgi:hypothetical protein
MGRHGTARKATLLTFKDIISALYQGSHLQGIIGAVPRSTSKARWVMSKAMRRVLDAIKSMRPGRLTIGQIDGGYVRPREPWPEMHSGGLVALDPDKEIPAVLSSFDGMPHKYIPDQVLRYAYPGVEPDSVYIVKAREAYQFGFGPVRLSYRCVHVRNGSIVQEKLVRVYEDVVVPVEVAHAAQ